MWARFVCVCVCVCVCVGGDIFLHTENTLQVWPPAVSSLGPTPPLLPLPSTHHSELLPPHLMGLNPHPQRPVFLPATVHPQHRNATENLTPREDPFLKKISCLISFGPATIFLSHVILPGPMSGTGTTEGGEGRFSLRRTRTRGTVPAREELDGLG